ncbi:MAG: PP2C family protein-serine/threonine phosphatase [Acidimicrobiales bacterium]
MIASPVLLAVALGCALAAVVWLRSSIRLERAARRIRATADASRGGEDAALLAEAAFRKELHTGVLYAILAGGLAFTSLSMNPAFDAPMLLLAGPVAGSLVYGRRFLRTAQQVESLSLLERKYDEALDQEARAPQLWARRLAPHDLPGTAGFEVGQAYEAGSGVMAGDFYDLYPIAPRRVAAVIGDVSGHGIEPSITAFQVKYLLRVFLRQYRDPAQAIEELNQVLSAQGGPEEFVSLCAVVFDLDAGTLRFCSAGHPAAWLWHDREVRALRATGPLLTIDPTATYHSREVELQLGDLLLMYTDGLAEARSGEQLFGEERIAQIFRRDPGQDAGVLCKSLLEAARDFSAAPLSDDVAILAIRRT